MEGFNFENFPIWLPSTLKLNIDLNVITDNKIKIGKIKDNDTPLAACDGWISACNTSEDLQNRLFIIIYGDFLHTYFKKHGLPPEQR